MELEIIRAIQDFANPFWDVVMEGLTLFGEPLILAGIFCAVYWCFDKGIGRYLVFALCASLCLNGLIKDVVKAERPIGELDIVSKRVETATGHSFPSGHTQSAAVFWTSLAAGVNRSWVRVLAVVIILGVGLSRLYLGLHFPTDVLAGLVFGAVMSLVFYRVIHKLGNYKLAIGLCIVLGAVTAYFGESPDTFKAIGMLCGLFVGIWFEERFVRFDLINASEFCKLLRYLFGMFTVGVFYYGSKLLLPDIVFFHALRYGLIVAVVIGLWPYVFTKLGF